MNLYKRGKVWWIEYEHLGVRHRVSTHHKEKSDALGVLRTMQSGQLAKSKLAPLVESICGFYGTTLKDALPELCASADVELAKVEADAKTALKTAPEVTIENAWTSYFSNMTALGKTPSEYTLNRRHNEYLRLVKWLKTNAPLAKQLKDIDGQVAMSYAVHLNQEGKSTKTRKNIIGELCTIWKLLSKSCKVENPWNNISPRDTDGTIGEPFTRQEEAAVFAAARKVGKQWFEVCMLMRHTGLRYADAARLKWAEIDLAHNVINRTPTKTARHGVSVHIPICSSLRLVIQGMKSEAKSDYLFPVHAELYGNRGKVSKVLTFREVLELAKVERAGVTIHSWRHTFNTRLAEAGADKETRKRLSGHTQDATSDRYNHAEFYATDLKAIEAAATGAA